MDTTNILARKLIALFPEEGTRNNVQSILDSYGIESHEQEPVRVTLGILKLSGGNIKELRKMTKYAKEDFRGILTWAEYPRQSKRWSMPDGVQRQQWGQTPLPRPLRLVS
jgi:hypothetical protein